MTYQQLLENLQAMPTEMLATDVTVVTRIGRIHGMMQPGEVYAAIDFIGQPWAYRRLADFETVNGVLDDDHPYLVIDA